MSVTLSAKQLLILTVADVKYTMGLDKIITIDFIQKYVKRIEIMLKSYVSAACRVDPNILKVDFPSEKNRDQWSNLFDYDEEKRSFSCKDEVKFTILQELDFVFYALAEFMHRDAMKKLLGIQDPVEKARLEKEKQKKKESKIRAKKKLKAELLQKQILEEQKSKLKAKREAEKQAKANAKEELEARLKDFMLKNKLEREKKAEARAKAAEQRRIEKQARAEFRERQQKEAEKNKTKDSKTKYHEKIKKKQEGISAEARRRVEAQKLLNATLH